MHADEIRDAIYKLKNEDKEFGLLYPLRVYSLCLILR